MSAFWQLQEWVRKRKEDVLIGVWQRQPGPRSLGHQDKDNFRCQDSLCEEA